MLRFCSLGSLFAVLIACAPARSTPSAGPSAGRPEASQRRATAADSAANSASPFRRIELSDGYGGRVVLEGPLRGLETLPTVVRADTVIDASGHDAGVRYTTIFKAARNTQVDTVAVTPQFLRFYDLTGRYGVASFDPGSGVPPDTMKNVQTIRFALRSDPSDTLVKLPDGQSAFVILSPLPQGPIHQWTAREAKDRYDHLNDMAAKLIEKGIRWRGDSLLLDARTTALLASVPDSIAATQTYGPSQLTRLALKLSPRLLRLGSFDIPVVVEPDGPRIALNGAIVDDRVFILRALHVKHMEAVRPQEAEQLWGEAGKRGAISVVYGR